MPKLIYLSFAILLLISGKSFAQNDPVSIFNQVWHSYDTLYSGFAHKDINWNILYSIYRSRINEKTSESELFETVTDMLRHLNDNHVQIDNENPKRYFSAGIYGYLVDDIGLDSAAKILFTSLPISEKYFKYSLNTFNKFSYGWLQDSIGYFHFGEFKNLKATQEAMDKIVQYFSTSKAIIVDVRRNMGGEDLIGKAIADYFADEKREYMITAEKNGPGHNDFGPRRVWYIEPKSVNYSKPVILLTDNTSFSEAEIFALAMREIPYVKIVGDNTSGAYADTHWRILPCGWNVCIPYGLVTDKNGFSWEGIGIPPDYYIKTNPKKPITEKDELIEFSTKLINTY